MTVPYDSFVTRQLFSQCSIYQMRMRLLISCDETFSNQSLVPSLSPLLGCELTLLYTLAGSSFLNLYSTESLGF